MHDLLHDLAISVAKNECCIVNSFDQNIAPGIRHVCLISPDSTKENASIFLNKFGQLRSLRVPNMGNSHTSKTFIETCLKRFRHLRMLDLSGSALEVLPKRMGKLQNLQTLFFQGCGQTEKLPKDMRYMISLRFLSITTKQRDIHGHGLEYLKSLRVLAFYNCENLEYLFEMIQKLTFLHTLWIVGCKNLVSLPHGLIYLTSLQSLVVGVCEKLDLSRPQGFKEKEYDYNRDDHNNGFSLQSLYIVDLPKMEALPEWLLRGSGNSLKNLTIKDCVNLSVSPEWHNLTSLEKVEIIHCPELSSLPKTMLCLKHLKIEDCPLLSERCKQETGVDWHKIAHASMIVLNGNTISDEDN